MNIDIFFVGQPKSSFSDVPFSDASPRRARTACAAVCRVQCSWLLSHLIGVLPIFLYFLSTAIQKKNCKLYLRTVVYAAFNSMNVRASPPLSGCRSRTAFRYRRRTLSPWPTDDLYTGVTTEKHIEHTGTTTGRFASSGRQERTRK